MFPLALLVVVATGCNAVFGIDTQTPIDLPCGPYGVPQPVIFDGAALAGAYDLRLDATAMHGLVRVGSGLHPAIIPVLQMPDLSYAEDKSREGNLASLVAMSGLFTGHITASANHLIGDGTSDPDILADMFGAVLPENASEYQVQHFSYTTKKPAGWVSAENTTVDGSSDQSVYPGNELELSTDSPMLFTRYLSVVRVDENLARAVDVDEMLPSSQTWIVDTEDHVQITAAINGAHAVQQAVIALGSLPGTEVVTHPLTLVYSATSLDDPPEAPPHIFTSAKTGDGFPIGSRVPIEIEDGEFLEPWVNVDCSSLWFRRDSTVYRADAM